MWNLFQLILFIGLGTSQAADKSSVLKALGPYSYEVDYFDEKRFEGITFEHFPPERASLDPQHQKDYQRYLAYGVKEQLEPSRRIASVSGSEFSGKLRYPIRQNLGLIAFKRGELAATCPKIVSAAKALGSSTIAYYHPVHFTGGNSGTYKMPKDPVYGKHWRFELTNNFSQSEFEACLDLVSEAGLSLHYIPHLESISALIDNGSEKDWRLLSGIPIDNQYFHHSFGPLLTYFKKRPKAFRKKTLELTVAAEIDPMVFSNARTVRGGIAWLRSEFSRFKMMVPKFYLNTNGDFHHGKELTLERGVDCKELSKLLSEIDAMTPSMYGDKGHFTKTKDGKISLPETLTRYRQDFSARVSELCPGTGDVVKKTPVGFGEFALEEGQSYADVLSAPGELKFVQYWTHGKWDHLGIVGNGDEKFRKDILRD